MTPHPPGGLRGAADAGDRLAGVLPAEPSTSPGGVRAPGLPDGSVPHRPLSGRDPVLEEIDRIWYELHRDSSRAAGSASVIPFDPAKSERVGPEDDIDEPPEPAGARSGYFEEQLTEAGRSVGGMDDDLARLDSSLRRLRGHLATVRTDLTRIAQEWQYHQRRAWSEEAPGSPASLSSERPSVLLATATGQRSPAAGPARSVAAESSENMDGSPAPTPPYAAFTVARYNRTMTALKGRRARLAAFTLLLSAGISSALVALVLYSPATHPPIWIAALPLVWVVPIPFFLLSFRGAQRVLGHNHLNLPEAE